LLFFKEKFRVFPVVFVFFVIFCFFWFVSKQFFRLFCFFTETESFDVLIEPKQTEDPPKQFKREYIWVFFRKFWVASVCFETVLFVSVVLIKVRNTETNRNF